MLWLDIPGKQDNKTDRVKIQHAKPTRFSAKQFETLKNDLEPAAKRKKLDPEAILLTRQVSVKDLINPQ